MRQSQSPAPQQRRQGDHDRETESQHESTKRVGHLLEAGRRIKNPRGKQKVSNKESVTPGRTIQEPRGKRKVNNKESVTEEAGKRLKEPMGTWENRKSTTKSQHYIKTLKQP